jgi:hypothetical protein
MIENIKISIILFILGICILMIFLWYIVFSPVFIFWRWLFTDKPYLKIAVSYFKEMFGDEV